MRETAAATCVSADEANRSQRKPLAHRFARGFNLLDAELWGAPQWLIVRSGEIQHQAHTWFYVASPRNTASQMTSDPTMTILFTANHRLVVQPAGARDDH